MGEVEFGTRELVAVTITLLAQLAGVNISAAMSRFTSTAHYDNARRAVISTSILSVAAAAIVVGAIALGTGGCLGEPAPVPRGRQNSDSPTYNRHLCFAGPTRDPEQGPTDPGTLDPLRNTLTGEAGCRGRPTGLVPRETASRSHRAPRGGCDHRVLIRADSRIHSAAVDRGSILGQCFFRCLLAYSLPLVPNGILQFCLHSSDRYFISALCGGGALGHSYALGYKLGYVTNYLILGRFLLHGFLSFSSSRATSRRSMIGRLTPYFMLVLTAATLATSLFADVLVGSASRGHGFIAATGTVPWVATGYWCWGAVPDPSNGLLRVQANAATSQTHVQRACDQCVAIRN